MSVSRIPALMMGFFGLLIPVVIYSTAALSAKDASDPFATYANVVPGQPISALTNFSCQQRSPETHGYQSIYCQIKPDTGPITIVVVTGRNGIIEWVSFIVKDVYLLDMRQRWGQMDTIERKSSGRTVMWDKGN